MTNQQLLELMLKASFLINWPAVACLTNAKDASHHFFNITLTSMLYPY